MDPFSPWSVPCHLYSDSLTTVQRAAGLWRLQDGAILPRTCRALAQAVEAIGLRPWEDVSHVRGHAGDVGNECADGVAGWACRHGAAFCHFPGIGDWVRDGSIQELWLILETVRDPSGWPALWHTSLVTPMHAPPCALPAAGHFGAPAADRCRVRDQGWVQLRLISMNVQTLEEGGERPGVGGDVRVAYLKEQVHGLGAHVVAVQEARTAQASSVLSGLYIRLCGGCSPAGHHGVEAWFLRTPGADGVAFGPQDLTVVHHTPRLLCVKVASRHLRALVVVCHAPTAADVQKRYVVGGPSGALAKACHGRSPTAHGGLEHAF